MDKNSWGFLWICLLLILQHQFLSLNTICCTFLHVNHKPLHYHSSCFWSSMSCILQNMQKIHQTWIKFTCKGCPEDLAKTDRKTQVKRDLSAQASACNTSILEDQSYEDCGFKVGIYQLWRIQRWNTRVWEDSFARNQWALFSNVLQSMFR
jgi:hypothetical protein